MGEARKAFLLRVSADLWREIEAWAQQDLRSVNGQIEFLLREAVVKRRGKDLGSGVPPVPRSPATRPAATPAASDQPLPPSSGPADESLEVDRHD